MNDKVRKVFYKKIRKQARNRSNSNITFIREIASLVEKKLPIIDRESVFSHSENTTLFNDNICLHKDENQHGGSVTTTASVSSVEMQGAGLAMST